MSTATYQAPPTPPRYYTLRHVALTAPDILTVVFANLEQPDLAQALLVCRQWNEWSDLLWRSLPTLAPLLRLSFPFVFTSDNDRYIQSVPLYQLDRLRLAQLARSVQYINASDTLSGTFFHDYNPNIPGLLLDVCEPGAVLFPRLKSLATQCRNDAELFGVLPLLNSSLRSLEVSVHHSAIDFMTDLLGGIEQHATSLEQLDICCQPRSIKPSNDNDAPARGELDLSVYLPPIASVLSALSYSLHTLSVPGACMSIDTLLALARLPHLKSLAFTGPWLSEIHGDEWPELDSSSFEALAHVILPCSVSAASRLLAAIPDLAPVHRVEITSPSSQTDQDVSELCSTLSRFRASLCHVSLKQLHIDSGLPLKWCTAFDTLLSCSRLEKLHLSLPLEMSDTDVEKLVSHFSWIKSLSLSSGTGLIISSVGLYYISNLRALYELDITTSAFEQPVQLNGSDSKRGPSESAAADLHLNVGASTIHGPVSAARLIRFLFPHQKIDLKWTSLNNDEQRDICWGQARDLIFH